MPAALHRNCASCFLYDREPYSMQIAIDLITSTFEQRSENVSTVDGLCCETIVKSIQHLLIKKSNEEGTRRWKILSSRKRFSVNLAHS